MDNMRRKDDLIGILILFTIILFTVGIFRENRLTNEYETENLSISNPLLLGTNLGVWGEDWYWDVNEPFIKSKTQREMAKGVITSFRFPCRNFSDQDLMKIVGVIKESGAIPFVVLPANNDTRAEHVVELFGDRVEWYEYGNEVDWWFGMSPEEHARRFCEAYPKLKSINPELNLGGPVQGHTNLEHYEKWADELELTYPEVKPDFISFHKYWAYGTESNKKILDEASNFGKEIEDIRYSTVEIFGKDLPLIVSEWNWHAVPDNYDDNRDMDETFIKEFTRIVLKEMDDHNVYMAHQFCYGSGCANGHLDMVTWNETKPQFEVFLEISEDIS
ncbi:MAG: hypothetical protein GF368_04530 [Candidatus Aenigmarchaeota archaeon]|nr:hypothetical protein [Candidatus Aenigmarchaeota archaeon]